MSKDKFEWTEDLIMEFALWCKINHNDWISNNLKKFIESKTPKPERGWEIVAYKMDKKIFELYNDGLYYTKTTSFPHCYSEKDFLKYRAEIHSVKRPSDGEVFSVGDVVNTFKQDGAKVKIEGFEIYDGELCVYFQSWNRASLVSYWLAKAEHVKEKPVLFTTEDGVEMYDGDSFWYINSNLDLFCFEAKLSTWAKSLNPGEKTFSTKEKAEEYIKMNKPLNISMKEIASCVTDYLNSPSPGVYRRAKTEIDLDKLDALIKSKQ